jgi:hypothetical protein
VMVRFVRCEIISPTINLVLVILIRVRNVAAEFCRRASILLVRFFYMR